MYKLTCGKCLVCFLFLVMVAFLSCSAFRIDSAAMDASVASVDVSHVQLRHAKHYSRHVPLTVAPSSPVRAQRSPYYNSHHPQLSPKYQSRKTKPCQEQDLARKAYAANTVVLAKAESMSMTRVRNYSVSFRILMRFKKPEHNVVDDILRLTFLNDTRRMNCESELHSFAEERGGSGHLVVKAQIRPAMEYYLFLNTQGNHNYSVVGTPVLKRRKRAAAIEKVLREVTRKTFVPKLRKPELIKPDQLEPGKKVRLVCKVKGYPVPVIEWKKNETVLHANPNIRITYRGEDLIDRRKSTLVIRRIDERDSGRYTCIAHGADDRVTEASTELRIANKEKCDNNLFCLNGGTCKNMRDLKEPYCICSEGYRGERCDQKQILEPQPSFMYEDD